MVLLVVVLLVLIAAWQAYAYIAQVLAIPLYSDKGAVLGSGHDLDAGGTFRKKLDIDAMPRRAFVQLLAWRSSADRIYTLATLTPEKASAHSPWAVAIKLGRRTVGHLSGADTYQLRRATKRQDWHAQTLTCPAAITGRHTRNYNVWLDVPGWS